ncbi:MAG: YfhO family protein [Paludibacteraceae bacterium]|nr:YfhO family protein [Paludibacteraceae bacterium]
MKEKLSKKGLKCIIPYVVSVLVFIMLACIYASPVLSGKVLQAGDNNNWKGMSHEAVEYGEKTDGNTYWTNSMFGGMPTYQITTGKTELSAPYGFLTKCVRLGFKDTLMFLICYFLSFFILLKSFRINTLLSVVGAIAISMSSYFYIIIPAGHFTKACGIAMMAPVLAGFYLIFHKRYILGALLTMLYVCLGFMMHPQMSYYYILLIGVLCCAELYVHAKEKRWKDFGIACFLFVGSLFIGLGTSYPNIKINLEYLTETMRGGHSELVKESDKTDKPTGLSIDYATSWSYGIDESFTFLIPGFKGNASGYSVDKKSEVYRAMIENHIPSKQAAAYCKQLPTYWGTQPFTAGPVYMGAIICFLFVLGLLIVKGPYKWALLVATIFSVLLSWGSNFMPLTEVFFNYFPMYNKFRAVSSILVVAEITMPLLAILALKDISEGRIKGKELEKKIMISFGIVGGLCVFFYLFANLLFDFTSPIDQQIFAQQPSWYYESILKERSSMLTGDALRSFVFIALAALSLFLFVKGKINRVLFIGSLGVLILLDMWPINKRYFNDTCFVSMKQNDDFFKKMPWEKQLLETDKDPNYRLLNLTTNTFNDARTSYYFKSIGGYHAAKLRRYQDLIEEHISKFNMSVLNMLNTKYIVVKGADGYPLVQYNHEAMGNAWFVDSLLVVNTPNEESDALNVIDVRKTAVLDAKFGEFVEEKNFGHDSLATIRMVSYEPNKLVYESNSTKDGTIVFSEIYYPYGWHASIDGTPVEHFRVNYVLRALNVPEGKHTIQFYFYPDSYTKALPVAYASYVIIYILLFVTIGWAIIECFGLNDRVQHILNKYRKNPR